MKGLIVEQHEDRVIVSTEQGETPVMRDKISEIEYDDPAQTFLQIGESHEKAERWGEALAYYEKALQAQPELEDAKRAVVRVRNRFWSKSASGPSSEIEKRQELYDHWGEVKKAPARTEENIQDRSRDEARSLEEGLGLVLEQKGDWTKVSQVSPKKDAAFAGLKRGDRLVSLDGLSLRYLNADVVRDKLLVPSRAVFTMEFERDCALTKTGFEKSVSEFGFKAELEYRGAVVASVEPEKAAARAGLKENDLLVTAGGAPMRYTPLKKLLNLLLEGPPDSAVLSVRRSVTMTRK